MEPFALACLFLLAVSIQAQASPRAETFRMGFNVASEAQDGHEDLRAQMSRLESKLDDLLWESDRLGDSAEVPLVSIVTAARPGAVPGN